MAQRKKKTDPQIERLQQELLNEIGNLRVTSRDIISRFQTNLEAQMVWCINTLSVSDEEDLPESLLDPGQLKQMIDMLRELKIKPSKGRLKDIRRIRDAVNELYAQLVEQ